MKAKVGLFGLIAFMVSAMLGSGVFDLPSNISHQSALGPILIALSIAFVGMLCLSCVFKDLSIRAPKLNAGVYAYAKAGFGNYIGFNAAWGYWIAAWVGDVSFIIMLTSALASFFPILANGYPALILNSALVWTLAALCLHGIKSTSFIDILTTTIQLATLAIFFVFVFYAFNYKTVTEDVWGQGVGKPVITQIKSTVLVILWAFTGIEGACVLSARAKNHKDVGRATLLAFIIVFSITLCAVVLPFGLMNQKHLMLLKTPSTAGIMEYIAGSAGGKFMYIAIPISILGGLLSWMTLASEVPYVASKVDGLFPKVFGRVNSAGSPRGTLYITAIAQQIYLLIAHFNQADYLKTISLATYMILLPYFFSAAYALLTSIKGKGYEYIHSSALQRKARIRSIILSTGALLFCVWLVYAAGLHYLLLSSVLYGIGMTIYVSTRLMNSKKVFTHLELLFALAVLGTMCITLLSNYKPG